MGIKTEAGSGVLFFSSFGPFWTPKIVSWPPPGRPGASQNLPKSAGVRKTNSRGHISRFRDAQGGPRGLSYLLFVYLGSILGSIFDSQS